MKKEDIVNLSLELLSNMLIQNEEFDSTLDEFFRNNPESLNGQFNELSSEELLNCPKIKELLLSRMGMLINSIKIVRDSQMEEPEQTTM